MSDLTYNVTRQQAADLLWVSTRSVDRYVKWWKLSYKKISNKVLLAREEISDMQQDFDLLHQHPLTDTTVVKEKLGSTKVTRVNSWLGLWSVKEFTQILSKKDSMIEEKNQMIYILQRKIGEIETKMQQMIALPDHSAEKETLLLDVQRLEMEKKEVESSMRKEKLMNTIFLGLALISVIFVLFFLR